MTLLEVNNLSKSFPIKGGILNRTVASVQAVRDVTFSINAGETVGVIGESGCGKSTLTRAILGLEDVQDGSITMDGAPVYTGKRPNLAVRRKMQVVFQDPYGSFNPRHKVARLIAEPFHLLDDPPQGQARVDAISEALMDVGLQASDADKYIHEFSGGQRQRVGICRALIQNPAVLLVDEPTASLDPKTSRQIMRLICELCKERGLAAIINIHDVALAQMFVQRVIGLRFGAIEFDGLPEDLTPNVLTTIYGEEDWEATIETVDDDNEAAQ